MQGRGYCAFAATAVAMTASVAQIAWLKFTGRAIEAMHWINLTVIVVFGGATLLLHDDAFIKWKPTVLYAAMALALAVALWGYRKNFLRIMLGSQLSLPDQVWHRLTVAWVLYCVFMAVLNGYVAAFWSTNAWMDFKLWGYVFPVVFIIGQGIYVARHLQEPAETPTPGGSA